MSDKFVTYNEDRPTPTGLPQAVDAKINTRYATKAELNSAIIGTGGVVSPSVSRIIASSDPDTPLSDGDLLLVYAPPQPLLEDFADGLDGWSPMWQPYTWAHEVEGDDGMATVTPVQGQRGVLISDTFGEAADVEVVARLKASGITTTVGNGVGVRLSGPLGQETGYTTAITPDGIALLRYQNGAFANVAGDTLTVGGNDVWYWIRVRAQGDTVRVRAWTDGVSEPTEWHITYTSSAVPGPGRVGLAPGSRERKNYWSLFGAIELETGDEIAPVVTP